MEPQIINAHKSGHIQNVEYRVLTGAYYYIKVGARSEREQIASFLHECLHIWRRDHDRADPVGMIEQEIHEELREILSMI